MAKRLSTQPVSSEAGSRLPVVAFTGGGTAGHVFPGLAVAEELGAPAFWIGAADGLERRLVAAAGMEFRGIPAGKLRRYLSLRNVSDVVRILAGVVAAVGILRRERPALLFSKGGFVSVPPVVAAWLCRIPSWTHESDFDPGLATRINLRFCERVLVSFPQTLDFLPASCRVKAVVSGNPVRSALYSADAARGRRFAGCGASRKLVVVIGGSQGSAFINGLVEAALPGLRELAHVVHQTGESGPARAAAEGYLPVPFIGPELPDVLAAADLVVSRAGANTLAELSALGKPSLLIPLPMSGSRGDQLRNAELFRRHDAAVVVHEAEATPQAFVAAVGALLADKAALARMGAQARSISPGRPSQAIAQLLRERLR